MVTIFLKKYPSAKKPATTHTRPPKRKRRNEKQSEIVLLEKQGEIYRGTKMPFKQSACAEKRPEH